MDVTIETTDLIQKQGKNGAYYQQLAFVNIPNPDGSPQRYPRQIKIFAPRDNKNKPVSISSRRVRYAGNKFYC